MMLNNLRAIFQRTSQIRNKVQAPPDRVTIPCLMLDTCFCQIDDKLSINSHMN